jgi:hypothetical protein
MKRPPFLLLILLLTVANLALSLSTTLPSDQPLMESGSILGSDQAAISNSLIGIEKSLGKIEKRLAALEAKPGQPIYRSPSPPAGESLNVVDLKNLISETSELKDALNEILHNLPTASAPLLSDVRKENPTPKWDELQKTILLWSWDEVKAQNELVMLSEREVLIKFGAPTEMWSSDKGVNWLYGSGHDPEGGYLTEVWLLFLDGHVTVLGVK